ncbi:hypothetical protein K437DRAFT_261010 [Tilletiaria anomala UBC 951]|uniref:Integral membrane protein n=1 Tax=Tilletiaria anomala (strain ATCC 24038 / CBS 436.72 / UBC 951) TaxID=1037660 RepID=A0A066WQ77_TILAU|nr:uncharacterized protein K437DRAFT_261010 [Tilletiaria anomala UBC 951]KDN52775.1 hypothetical protein K437DRAFT_261010 [Tilletiaria anomala UBC 951]
MPPHTQVNFADTLEAPAYALSTLAYSPTGTASPPVLAGSKGLRRSSLLGSITAQRNSRVGQQTRLQSVIDFGADQLGGERYGESVSGLHEHDAEDLDCGLYEDFHHVLDVVDPEVAMRRTLMDIQNEIFAPPFSRLPSMDSIGIGLPTLASLSAMFPTPASTPSPAIGTFGDREYGRLRQSTSFSSPSSSVDLEAPGSAGLGTFPPPLPRPPIAASILFSRRVAPSPDQQWQQAAPITPSCALSLVRTPSNITVSGVKRSPQPKAETSKRAVGDATACKHADDEDEAEREQQRLEEHIRQLLTCKEKFKHRLKGFWNYITTPMGFFFLCYGFAVFVWGVLIFALIVRWWNPRHRRHWIEICDQVLTALFTLIGLGFAPFRAVDTYRMINIVHLHRRALRRRYELGLPTLEDPNDLPRSAAFRAHESKLCQELPLGISVSHCGNNVATPNTASKKRVSVRASNILHLRKNHANGAKDLRCNEETIGSEVQGLCIKIDVNSGKINAVASYLTGIASTHDDTLHRSSRIVASHTSADDASLLSLKNEMKLVYHQRKFYHAHHYYRFNESITHRAFSLKLMIAIVLILDIHSCLQACLGGLTWGIRYQHRPTALTASIVTASLSCSAIGGILISIGNSRTKKNEVVERLLHEELEEEARRRMRKDGLQLQHKLQQ